MRNEAPPIYNFKFNGGIDKVYSFDTKNNVDYLVRFKPSADYILPEERWRDDFYELVIEVASAPDPTHIPADRSVFPTIEAIISHFFSNHQRVILYICDDSDSREVARKRKFDIWYTRLASRIYEKYDLPTVFEGSERYFASVFFRRDNPDRIAILTAFGQFETGNK